MSSTVLTTVAPALSEAEIKARIEEFGRKNEESYRAAGIPIVDFRTETPNTHLSVIFYCTPTLRGRITPYLHHRNLFVLDFISEDNKRFEKDTKLNIYDVGVFGEEKRMLFYPQGSLPNRRSTVDVYTLNPGRTVHICRRSDERLLKTLSFTCSDGKVVPRIE